MNTQTATLNQDQLNYWRKRRVNKVILKSVLALFLIIVICYFACEYLANIPRERADAKLSYFGRVKNGLQVVYGATFLAMTAEHEVPNTTMPIVELSIKGNRLDELNKKLPESGKEEQKAEFKIEDKIYKVKARYRGDSINHWAYPQKSWRVQLEKDKEKDDLKIINLVVPRLNNQIYDWLGYEMARTYGDILVPYSELVHFRLNKQYDGIRLLLEQPDLEFIHKRNLPPGKIYVGDITSEQIYSDEQRKQIYLDPTAWTMTRATSDVGTREIDELINIIKNESDLRKYEARMERLMNMTAMTKFIALQDMVGTVHIDETHNGKFFFDPVSGKFSPLAWDMVAYMWGNSKSTDLAANQLSRGIMQIPDFSFQKDQALWNMIKGPLSAERLQTMIDQKANEIRPDIYAYPLKVHANGRDIKFISNEEWEQSIKDLKKAAKERNKTHYAELSKNNTDYKLIKNNEAENTYTLLLSVASRAPAKLNKIKLELPADFNDSTVTLTRRGLKESFPEAVDSISATVVNSLVEFELGEMLFSRRSVELKKDGMVTTPGYYAYDLKFTRSPDVVPTININLENPYSAKKFKAELNAQLEMPSKLDSWWSVSDFGKNKVINYRGDINLKEDLLLDRYTTLNIEPGTQIRLAEGVSIISEGGVVNINGSKESPVSIAGENNSLRWGVIAGLNGAKLNINNANIVGGTHEMYQFVRLDAPINLYYADADIKNTYVDGYASLKYANVKVNESHFKSIFENPLVIENASVVTDKVHYEYTPPAHSPDLIGKAAVGTPSRIEREYKYTFTNFDLSNTDGLTVAGEIQQALRDSITIPNHWSAPKYVGNNYYIALKPEEFMYRDIYLDTPDFLNFKYDVAYRFRNRFEKSSYYEWHLEKPSMERYWPYRLEFQAKTFRKEIGLGFSELLESRFELRKESKPFSDYELPPLNPWREDVFIPIMQSGEFEHQATVSGQAVMEFYQKTLNNTKPLTFKPSAILVTDRYRQHLDIKSPYGSGPNPEQAYIITLDASRIYNGETYMQLLSSGKFTDKNFPELKPDATLLEVEVEFERNVSDVLDKKIQAAEKEGNLEEKARLEDILKAFLSDQEKIMTTVSEYFAKKGIEFKPIGMSKYVQSMRLLGHQR